MKFSVREINLFERDVRLRMPFRFGIVTLTESPQAFARVRIRLENGAEAEGAAAALRGRAERPPVFRVRVRGRVCR